jgi:hypothetical protein
VAVPLDGRDGVLLAFSARLQEDAAAEPQEAGEHSLALLPAAASAAGRCMAATGVVHAFAPTAGCVVHVHIGLSAGYFSFSCTAYTSMLSTLVSPEVGVLLPSRLRIEHCAPAAAQAC